MSNRAWPLSLAAHEGLATARTGRWTSLLLILAVAWMVAAPGVADAVGVTHVIDAEREWIDAGGHVFVVTGARTDTGQNPIPALECEHLSAMDGIGASFALRRTSVTGTLTHIPGGRASLFEVSPGALNFLGVAAASQPIVVATSGFADRTGIQNNDPVRVVQRGSSGAAALTSDPLVVRVTNATTMGDEFDGSLLLPTLLTDNADACYVRTDAPHLNAVAVALPALLAHEGTPAVPRARLYSSDFTVDYTTAFEDRPLRWLWVPSVLLLGLIWAMVQWFRRAHTAIYATFGMRTAPRMVMQVTEWGVLATVGLLWGWSLGVVGALALGAHVHQAVVLVSAHAGLTVAGASVLVVLWGLRPTGTLLNTLKER